MVLAIFLHHGGLGLKAKGGKIGEKREQKERQKMGEKHLNISRYLVFHGGIKELIGWP